MLEGFELPEDVEVKENCGVVAVTVASGKPYKTIENRFRFLCTNAANPRWKGGTTHSDRLKVMDDIGLTYEAVQIRGMNLNTFCDKVMRINELFMVTTTRHVQLVYKDNFGVVWYLDQRGVGTRDDRARSFRKKTSSYNYAPPLRITGGIMAMTKETKVDDLLPPVAVEMAKYKGQLSFNF